MEIFVRHCNEHHDFIVKENQLINELKDSVREKLKVKYFDLYFDNEKLFDLNNICQEDIIDVKLSKDYEAFLEIERMKLGNRAYETSDIKTIELLLLASKIDNKYCPSKICAIGYASRNGYLEIVKPLLSDSRVDPSDDNNYAIRWASENGHLEIVELLLSDLRVDPSDDDNYAIKEASNNGYVKIVNLLK